MNEISILEPNPDYYSIKALILSSLKKKQPPRIYFEILYCFILKNFIPLASNYYFHLQTVFNVILLKQRQQFHFLMAFAAKLKVVITVLFWLLAQWITRLLPLASLPATPPMGEKDLFWKFAVHYAPVVAIIMALVIRLELWYYSDMSFPHSVPWISAAHNPLPH